MINRKPAHENFLLGYFHSADHLTNIGQQVCVAEHHTFGIPRTPRCVLDEGSIFGVYRWKIQLFLFLKALFYSDNAQSVMNTSLLNLKHLRGIDSPGHDNDFGITQLRDGKNPLHAGSRKDWYGDPARALGTIKRKKEFFAIRH